MSTARKPSHQSSHPPVANAPVPGSRKSVQSPRLNEEPQHELRFKADDQPTSRIGDETPAAQRRAEFPPERVREAGRTGGEITGGGNTADDLSPETLLDSEPSHTPDSSLGRVPADTSMTHAEADAIGAGHGLDEAEWADKSPVGRRQAEELKHKQQQHANDARFMEPYGAQEQLEREKQERGD